jgi:hypothetical protein
VAAAAGAAAVACLPALGRTLSPDEAGLLIIADQWSPGSSLYGDHWVDRPPLLVLLFALLPVGAGPEALRLLGLVAVVLTVALAGALGRVVVPGSPTAPALTAVTAALMVGTPLFGGGEVNSETLGLPFVLAGMVCAVAWAQAARRGRPNGVLLLWAVGAGAGGAAAALVKQNLVDVGVLLAVLVVLGPRVLPPRPDGRPAPRALLVGGAALGAVATTAAVLAVAWTRGTPPLALLEALVGFRGEALEVIVDHATLQAGHQLLRLVVAAALTGTPLLVALLVRRARRGSRPSGAVGLGAATAAVLVWELTAVALGGSYWLHYLLGLVPGTLLLTAVAARRPPSRALRWGYAVTASSTAVAVTVAAVLAPVPRPQDPVIDFLAARAQPGDTAVVAFGGANVLRTTGLASPYEHLWSLPVRVRDPRLLELAAVLAGPRRPTWVVLQGDGLASWGLDVSAAETPLRRHYGRVGEAGGYAVYHLDEPAGAAAEPLAAVTCRRTPRAGCP